MASKVFLAIAVAALAGASPAVAAGDKVDWCASGRFEVMGGGQRTSLGPGAVMPVAEKHRARAEAKLRTRGFVRVSSGYAEKATGVPSRSKPGHSYVLARAGTVGSPGLSVSEHLERSGRIQLVGELSADRRKLIIWTLELSPSFPTRRLPVIVLAPDSVKEAASRCSHSA
jgi:hypothetical protein